MFTDFALARKRLFIVVSCCAGCGEAETVLRSCVEVADADWAVSTEQSLPQSTVLQPPLRNDDCRDSAVLEIDLASRDLSSLYYTRVWPSGTFENDQVACESARYAVSVFRGIEGSSGGVDWEREPFDQYSVLGVWDSGLCSASGAGRIGPTETNSTVGYPVSWVDTTPVAGRQVERVRVVVTPESMRGTEPLVFQFQNEP